MIESPAFLPSNTESFDVSFRWPIMTLLCFHWLVSLYLGTLRILSLLSANTPQVFERTSHLFWIACFPAETQNSQVPSDRFMIPWRLTVSLWRGHNLGLSRCKADYTRRNWGSVWILVGLYQDKTMLYKFDQHRPDSHIFYPFVHVD